MLTVVMQVKVSHMKQFTGEHNIKFQMHSGLLNQYFGIQKIPIIATKNKQTKNVFWYESVYCPTKEQTCISTSANTR